MATFVLKHIKNYKSPQVSHVIKSTEDAENTERFRSFYCVLSIILKEFRSYSPTTGGSLGS